MGKIKSFKNFLNEWYIKDIPVEKQLVADDIEKSLGYRATISFETDANNIKSLLWLYFLSKSDNVKDGWGFDYMDMIYFTGLAEKLMAAGELLPLEMEQVRAKMPYYAGQLAKIANYEKKRGKDGEVEKYLKKWMTKNADKYKVPEIPPAPPKTIQGKLF